MRTPTHEQFRAREVVDLEGAVFEEVDGRMMATVRILKSGTSKNRRTYPPKLVKEAVEKGIFNNIQMFMNHDRQKPEPQSRPLGEMVSAVESTSWDEATQSMNGRVEFFDRNFYDYAQRARNYMGVSINALVRGNRRTVKGETYEDVTEWVHPRSVDWVTAPAAGGAILAFEDEDDAEMIDWSKITVEDLKKNAASVYEAITAEAKATAEPPKNDPPEEPAKPVSAAEIAKLVQEGIEANQKAESDKKSRIDLAAKQVRDAFTKSGLPEKTRARLMAGFEGVEAYDEKAVTTAITEAQEELKAAGARGPQITGMGPTGSASGSAETPAVFSIHESVKSTFGFTKKSDAPKEGTK